MLNLEWFRTFKAIYETGNLSNAANKLFISQPGASLHLSSLEEYIGHRLFERSTRKMIATEQASVLYNYIVDSMNTLVEAENAFCRNSVEVKPTLVLGLGFETFEHSITEHIAQLPFNLTVRFGEERELLHDLDAGTIDLVLTSQVVTQPDLEYTSFAQQRIVLVCGGRTDTEELDQLIAAGQRTAVRGWLKKQNWYTTAADTGYLKNFWMANFDCPPDIRPNYILPYFGAILRCIGNGKGFAIMPDVFCRTELQMGTVRLVWEGDPYVENILHFGKRKKNRRETEIRQLQEILTKGWHRRRSDGFTEYNLFNG
jgi:DNA-binding transcriptional LysR family regulator